MEDIVGHEGQHMGEGITAEHVQHEDDHIADDDVEHQVGDGQIAVLGAEPVEPGIEGAQGQDLLMFRV